MVLGFEGFPSVTPLPADAYAAQGVTVAGAIVLTAPLYNWFSRPPHSGAGVITGDIDPPSGTPVTITLAFDQAYTSAEAFITSTEPVELRCTDGAGQSVGAVFSRAPNLVGGGIYPPNDHVQVTGAGIRGCTITGPSNRFVVDDVTLTKGCSAPPSPPGGGGSCALPGPDSVTIARFAVPGRGADSSSFTTKNGEKRIRVYARAWPDSFASRIRYRVADFPGDSFVTAIPTQFVTDTGTVLEFDVPAQDTMRFSRYLDYRSHLGRWEQKTLGFRIVAYIPDSTHAVESRPFDVRQDALDVLREEYIELLAPRPETRRHKVPARADLNESTTPAFPGENSGDYLEWMEPSAFKVALDSLEAGFTPPRRGQWQINVIFRSPVHNLRHVPASDDPNVDSWHIYGCAADLQTFPFPRTGAADTTAAESYWTKLATLARKKNFQIEARSASGIGHVHVERECY